MKTYQNSTTVLVNNTILKIKILLMNLLLDSAAIGWSLLALIVGIGGLILLFRYRFSKMSHQKEFDKTNTTINTRNKYSEVNVFKWSNTFLKIGMVMSLAFVVLAFNYTTFEKEKFKDFEIEVPEEIDQEPPITRDPPKPPPPPPPPPVKIEIPDEPLEEDTVVFVDQTLEVEEVVEAPPPPSPKEEAPVKPILPPIEEDDSGTAVIFAEQMPRFPGCEDLAADKKAADKCATTALLKFLSSKLNYPALARENGVQGTVVIRFIVEKDGNLTDMEIVKDPGAGLGREALRVVKLMNNMEGKWTPGKQNAHPVRVRFNLPVKFHLQN